MTIFLLLAGIILAAVFFWFEVARPFLALRGALRRLAGGDFRPVLLKTRSGFFREFSQRVRQISEMLQQLDRQISDEGFSLRAILASMVEGVLIVDRSQRVRLANDALRRMFEFEQSPINRSTIEVFRNHELQKAVEDALLEVTSRRIEIIHRTGTGDRHFEVYAAGLTQRSGATALGAVVVFHDITAVKELEVIRREFVANVSHEFRTPLSIINGYLETLLDGAMDDREMAERSLRVMEKNAQRLALLIEDLLTISRLEHRTQQLDLRETNLKDALHHTIERMESAIQSQGAEIDVSWEKDAEVVPADGRRIEQIYTNLLENALRYGPPGSTKITIVATLQEDSHVEIRFGDNGPGIPLVDQHHIFERFYRVHKDRSRVAGGTGLGLSIVKHIALAHGGSVALDSTPGMGSTFIVRLPKTS